MGVYNEHVLSQPSDEVDYLRLPSRTESPARPGLEVADWDYPTAEHATWVGADGHGRELGEMTSAYLDNVYGYLCRRHGEPWLLLTPLGRALQHLGARTS